MSIEDFKKRLMGSRPEWLEDALCAQVDTEMFFPEQGGTTQPAKSICAACDVREQCRAYAIENDERFGIWGGTSAFERRRLGGKVA